VLSNTCLTALEVDEECENSCFLQTPTKSTGDWINYFLSVPTFPVWMEVENERPPMYRMEPEVTIASVETLQDYAIVTIGERMDIFNAPSLMAQLNELVADGGAVGRRGWGLSSAASPQVRSGGRWQCPPGLSDR
jgi:hypothetical protein